MSRNSASSETERFAADPGARPHRSEAGDESLDIS
jgi:hypothetical protein